MGLVTHVSGHELGQVLPQQVLPDDDHRHAGGTHILLYARPDQAVLGDIAGMGEEHGGLIRHQDLALGVGQMEIGGAVDGLILADVDIVCVLGNVQVRAVGDIGEILVSRGGDDLHLTVLLGLLDGLFRPGAGLHIARNAVFHQVHGDHGELDCAAALDKQHLVVVRDAHQLPQVRLRLVPNLLEHLGPVTHLHHAHPAATVVHHLGCNLLQNLLWHHRRSC